MKHIFLQREDNDFSRRAQGKRILANYEGCKFDLADELPKMFMVFKEALENTKEQLLNFKPQFRSRALEASIMQSFFAEKLENYFSSKVFRGKYKRLILRVNGYLILFKKLNNKGYPMNIKTVNVQSILNQQQVLDLFADSDYNDEPLLYFGYQVNRFGEYHSPQLVYIDDNIIKFSISLDEEGGMQVLSENSTPVETSPSLRRVIKLNKAN